MIFKAIQSLNAVSLISVMVAGIEICDNIEQSTNAFSPIAVTLTPLYSVGITTIVTFVGQPVTLYVPSVSVYDNKLTLQVSHTAFVSLSLQSDNFSSHKSQ